MSMTDQTRGGPRHLGVHSGDAPGQENFQAGEGGPPPLEPPAAEDSSAPRWDVTPSQVVKSLTGFDEIAVRQAFGTPVAELTNRDRFGFMRALYFVALRREGVKDGDAYRETMETTLETIQGAFRGESADDPKTPSAESTPTPSI